MTIRINGSSTVVTVFASGLREQILFLIGFDVEYLVNVLLEELLLIFEVLFCYQYLIFGQGSLRWWHCVALWSCTSSDWYTELIFVTDNVREISRNLNVVWSLRWRHLLLQLVLIDQEMEPGLLGVRHADRDATLQKFLEDLIIQELLSFVDDCLRIRIWLLFVLSFDFVFDLCDCHVFVQFNFELSVLIHGLREHECDCNSLDVLNAL